jgi:uncharacterized repeat protein (TIGR03803 family)
MRARVATLIVTFVAGVAAAASSQDFQVIHQFAPATGFSMPTSLMQASDGYLYGTTLFSGNSHLGPGAIFRMTPQGALDQKIWFARASAVVESRGELWVVGQTLVPSARGIFRLRPEGELEVVRAFDVETEGYPDAPVVEGADGHLYGIANGGGPTRHGQIFRITTDGSITWLHAFSGADGAGAASAMIQGADGNLYGTMPEGGAAGLGTAFRMTPDGTVTVLHHFSTANGATPAGSLVQGLDGALYGTTVEGGAHGHGTVFKLTTTGTWSLVYAFTGGSDGSAPRGLVRTSDGRFCGPHSLGLHCVTPAGDFSPLGPANAEGFGPSLPVLGFDGYLYGFNTDWLASTVWRLRNPAPCDSTVALLYRDGVFDIRVTLRSELPAFTGAWLVHGGSVSPLWSTLIPVISPAGLVHVPLAPLPAIGAVGVLTLVVTSANDVCLDWRTLNTGGG